MKRIMGIRKNPVFNLRIIEPEGSTRVNRGASREGGARDVEDVVSDLGM